MHACRLISICQNQNNSSSASKVRRLCQSIKKTYEQFFVSTWRAITSWLPRIDWGKNWSIHVISFLNYCSPMGKSINFFIAFCLICIVTSHLNGSMEKNPKNNCWIKNSQICLFCIFFPYHLWRVSFWSARTGKICSLCISRLKISRAE